MDLDRNPNFAQPYNNVSELRAIADAREGLKIELTLLDGIWHEVHTIDGKPDPYIECLLNTHRIALPYTNDTDGRTILAYRTELEKVRPNHEVRFHFERDLSVLPHRRQRS